MILNNVSLQNKHATVMTLTVQIQRRRGQLAKLCEFIIQIIYQEHNSRCIVISEATVTQQSLVLTVYLLTIQYHGHSMVQYSCILPWYSTAQHSNDRGPLQCGCMADQHHSTPNAPLLCTRMMQHCGALTWCCTATGLCQHHHISITLSVCHYRNVWLKFEITKVNLLTFVWL